MQIEVLVEKSKGSCDRYEFDPVHGSIRLYRMLPSSLQHSSDYGFVPETLAENSEALGALVLVSESTFPGCLIRVEKVGGVQVGRRADDREARGPGGRRGIPD